MNPLVNGHSVLNPKPFKMYNGRTQDLPLQPLNP